MHATVATVKRTGNVFASASSLRGRQSSVRRMGPRLSVQIGLFFLAMVLIVCREKVYFLSPRFWAEEGVIFFSYARQHGVLATLLRPHLGYYSLFANLASIMAVRLAPLEFAPMVTTVLSLAVQCLPIALVVFGRCPYWQGLGGKVIVLACIFLAPLSYEVWLNTVNSQFYFCLFAALLLLEPMPVGENKARTWSLRVGLVMAGLTGVLSCLLLPLYWLRALFERQREVVTWALILSGCTLIQLAVVVFSHSMEVDSRIIGAMGVILPARGVHADLPSLGSILLAKTVLLNFLGPLAAEPLVRTIHAWHGQGGLGGQAVGYGGLILVVGLHLWLARRIAGPARYLLPGCFFLLVVPATVFALVGDLGVLIGVYAAQRYFYVPNILMLLMVYCAIDWGVVKRRAGMTDMALVAVLGLALVLGGISFTDFSGAQGLVYDAAWPKWRDEIALWRQDHSHSVRIWPAPEWRIISLDSR